MKLNVPGRNEEQKEERGEEKVWEPSQGTRFFIGCVIIIAIMFSSCYTCFKAGFNDAIKKYSIEADANEPVVELGGCALPLGMEYIEEIKSGVYVCTSLYGLCYLDIDIIDSESATVYVSLYPNHNYKARYGVDSPLYKVYMCNITDEGNLLEENLNFSIQLERQRIGLEIKVYEADSLFKSEDLIVENKYFYCIWLDENSNDV